MQLNLFENTDAKHNAVVIVAKSIMRSDSIRESIKTSIKNNDREQLIKLFNESIRTYGFSNTNFRWSNGVVTDRNCEEEFKVTASQLANVAIKLNN